MDKQQVLVVEDEPLVQHVLIDALEEAGFGVTTLASGEEAIEIFKGETGAAYVALITDINLAKRLTGWDLAQKARELNGALPVVYMTGAAADEWPSHGVPNSILITKPFAPAQIVTAIAQLLNASGSTTA